MSSIITLVIVLLAIAIICLILIFLHNKSGNKRAGLLLRGFNRRAHENDLAIAVTDKLVQGMLGLDYNNNKLLVFEPAITDSVIDLHFLKHCRKQKKWLHIPASKDNSRPETHLEKIILSCEFNTARPPLELVFYEYRYNSLFQMNELEQRADYWELLINQQMQRHDAI